MSYLYSSAVLPVPLGPSAPILRASCTDSSTTAPVDLPFYSGQVDFPQALNELLAVASTFSLFGAGCFAVVTGLKLYTAYDNAHTYAVGDYASYSGTTYICILASTGNLPTNATYWTATAFVAVTGLNLGVISGTASCFGQLEFKGGSVTLPDNTSQVYAWIKVSPWNSSTKTAGTLDKTATTTPPTANSVFLGSCTTLAGVISAIDYSGVCSNLGGLVVRNTNDRSAPVDSPTGNATFHTVTQSGTFHWNGSAYNSLTPTSAGALNIKLAATGDFTTLPQDNFHNICLDPNGANRIIYLPNPATVGNAWRCSFTHTGSANTWTVKDYTGVTTYCTLTTTNRSLAVFTYTNSSGVVAFPPAGGGWSPGPIPTPTAGAAI